MQPETQTPAPKSHSNVSIPLAIIVAGAMIAGAVYLGGGTPRANIAKTETTKEVKLPDIEPVGAGDHLLGNPNAEVIVVEYSDLECPFCKVFHATMHQIVNEYQGKVAWVFRNFPIKELHSKALKEAEASECAFDQGGNVIYWKFIDEVFKTTQGNNSLDPAELPKIASALGLNVENFNTCLDTGKFTQKIADDIKKAIDAGAKGTPFSVILKNGVEVATINGAEPMTSVRIKLDAALKN